MKLRYKYLRSIINEKTAYLETLKKVSGVELEEYLSLKYKNAKEKATLFNKSIQVTDAFWHLHSLNELFVDSVYEFRSFKEDPVIIDCGSNVGLSAIYFKSLYPNAQIIAYEADPSIFKLMIHNLNVFKFNDIIAINKAVWTEETTLRFKASGALGGSLFTDIKEGSVNDVVDIPTIRLRDTLRKFDEIDFLKIDIEGAEIEVLEDCRDSLFNVNNIFVEFHRLRGRKIELYKQIEILEKAEFKIYIKEAWNNLPKPFLHKEYKPQFDLQLNIFGYKD